MLSRCHAAAAGIVAATLVLSLAIMPAVAAGAAAPAAQTGGKKEEGFQVEAPQAILIDVESGSVLFEKNADRQSPPSSMMKLMTVEVVFNEIKSGRLKLSEEYRISENAWRRGGAPSGGSTMFAAIHSRVPVEDLLRGVIIQSGNDSCIALAEGLAGNENAFTVMMTKRARELGLAEATFGNASGLPDPRNQMSVRELATLGRHIIRTYPEFYKIFGEREFTWNKIRQQNRNPLLNLMTNADGLKTGFTKEGGYGMVGSAVQNNTRLLVVVNGLEDADDRASDAKKLLEWGFRNFEARKLFEADQVIGYARVFRGEGGYVALASPAPVQVMSQKGVNEKVLARIVYQGPVAAPIRQGQQIGQVRVWRGANLALEMPLFAKNDVAAGSLARRAYDGASELAVGLFRKLTK
jgi:D-alanyl-D-alanine carboxypeptidase (penicillin-binding protein 5/6)